MVDTPDRQGIAAGMAALSICVSLLLAMGDLRIMGEKEAVGVIADAAEAHRGVSVAGKDKDKALHLEVVAILDRILASGNSIRRP